MLAGAMTTLVAGRSAGSASKTTASAVRDAWEKSSGWNAAIGASTSAIDFFGNEMLCDPVPESEAGKAKGLLDAWLSPASLEKALTQRSRKRLWCSIREHQTLHINVLGASVTAGCGAEAPSIRCHSRWSWGRHLRDRLGALLGYASHLADVEVHVWGKNAVEASYFSQCTKSRFQLSSNTSVVLIELESAYQAGGERSFHALHALLARVRKAAPHAAIGFIAWPSQYDASPIERGLRNSTGMHGEQFDLVLASTLFRDAANISSLQASSFYADSTHPNLAGHVLLGSAAAYMIAKGILDTHCTHGVEEASSKSHHTSGLVPPALNATPEATEISQFMRQQKRIEETVEMCIGNADELPLVRPLNGWTLRDEGGAKGVRKLGYVSTRLGSVLQIGPLLPDIKCGMFDVSLGYLQSWRPEMGALRIACSGCTCNYVPGSWSLGAFPFPTVQAWSYAMKTASASVLQKDLAPLANASLTVSTRFGLFKGESECFLNVTHVPRFHAKNTTSRVRVDTLGIELASCMMNCHMSKYPSTKKFATRGRMCASGQDQGKPGYVAPACFTNGTAVCRLALPKEANEGL